MEIKSSLLNEESMKFVKDSLINVSEGDGKQNFRIDTLDYINLSAQEEDDEFFYDMLQAVRFLKDDGKTTAYTDPYKLIWLNCPGVFGENARWWDFIYDHECLHQLWDTFDVAEKLKADGIEYNHTLLNVASDCVINDYLSALRKKPHPDGLITPEYLKKEFNVVYDRKVDTQYTLYLKCLEKAKEIMDDPTIQQNLTEFDGKIKPKSVSQQDGGGGGGFPPQKHSEDYIKGYTQAIQDVLDKKEDPLKYSPKGGTNEYDKGYDDAMDEIKNGLEQGIQMSSGGGAGGKQPKSDLPRIPWDMPQQQGGGDSGDSDDSDKSPEDAANDAQQSANDAQQSANSAKDKANKSGKQSDKDAADKAQKAADKAKKAAQEAADAAKKGDKDKANEKAQEAANAASEASDAAGEEKGNGSGQGGSKEDQNKTAEQYAKDAALSSAEAKSAANRTKNAASGGDEKQKGIASKAEEAAKDAEKAAKRAADAAKKGDKKGAQKAAEEAAAASERAKIAEAEMNADENGGGDAGSPSGPGGSDSAPSYVETEEELEEIRKNISNVVKKYQDILSGALGHFVSQCQASKQMKETGLEVVGKAVSSWNQKMNIAINNFVKARIASKKRLFKRTYARQNRRYGGIVKFGETPIKGKMIERNTFEIKVAFFIDRSGSMGGCIDDVFDAAYEIAESMKKMFGHDKVVKDIGFKMHAFDYDIHELKFGKRLDASGGTCEFEKLLKYMKNNTQEYLINVVITDAEFNKVSKQECNDFLKTIDGMLLFITNNQHEVQVKAIADENKTKMTFILADPQFKVK